MTTDHGPEARPTTEVDRIANDYLDQLVELSPIAATELGIAGHDEDLDDFSPSGHDVMAALNRKTLDALDQATPVDDIDRVTVAAMQERLGLAQETHAAGLDQMSLNVLASPLQGIRGIFDLMPTATDAHWMTLATRLTKVPAALDSYVESLRASAVKGLVSPKRQVQACSDQCAELVAQDGYFANLVKNAKTGDAPLGEAASDALRKAVDQACAAYAGIGEFLRDELLAQAPEADACGRDRYQLLSRSFLGATVDLEETYQWGQQELARITAEMEAVAEQIRPGSTIKEAIELLDADPGYQLHGTDELKAWMQGKADEVITNLADSQFDIPEPVRRIECMIAPTQMGGIYYTGP
ncbi:MAG: DUF885 domain-containing protein, partial [Cellulomonas sp.]